MDQALFLENVTPGLTGLLVAAFVSTIAGILLGVLALTKGRPPPAFSGAVVGLLGLVGVGIVVWGAGGADPADADASWRAIALAVGPMLVLPFLAIVPALLHGLLIAVAGAGRGPRAWWVPAVALLPMGLAIAAPTIGGVLGGQGLFPLGVLRTVMYAIVGLLVLPSLLGGDPEEGGGPEAGAAGGLLFAGFVGIGEAAGRALFWFLMLPAFALVVRPEGRLELVARMQDELLAPAALWSWIAVAAAIVVGAVSLAALARHGGSRRLQAVLGVVWLAIAAVPMWVGDVPGSTWSALAHAIPVGEAPPAEPAAPE